MTVTIGFLCLLLGSTAAHMIRGVDDPEWLAFKAKFGKEYASPSVELQRYESFCKNKEEIAEHNKLFKAGLETFEMGINQFADWTEGENFDTYYNISDDGNFQEYEPPQDVTRFEKPDFATLQAPAEVNWLKDGLVTPVKDQKHCGSCWTFATTGSLEGQWKRKTGKLVSLSQQQLVDCNSKNYGCNGGFFDISIEYIKANGGIEADSTYEYIGKQGECRHNASNVVAKVESFAVVPNNEDALRGAVASVGPIAVTIATGSKFLKYKSGVFSHPTCSGIMDHAVLVVGYTDEYWLVKNSYGTQWGEDGYVKIARGKNMCKIASRQPAYPVV